MKPTPSGWPRISAALYYADAARAIDWLCNAFGFELRLKVEGKDGRIEHSELTFGEGVVMVAQTGRERTPHGRSPKEIGGGNTQQLMVYVDDVEAHCRRARAAGALILDEPQTHDYGEEYWSDRSYGCLDVEGHHWWFSQRLSTKGKA